MRPSLHLLASLISLVGCTALGPMPATTGVSAVPAGRPGGEIQGSLTPMFRLSEATRAEDPHGQMVAQLAGLFEPDRWLGMPGLIAGVRVFGEEGDIGVEPMLGYRHRLGRLSLAGLAFGTTMSAAENGASYEATRLGGEVALDAVSRGSGRSPRSTSRARSARRTSPRRGRTASPTTAMVATAIRT